MIVNDEHPDPCALRVPVVDACVRRTPLLGGKAVSLASMGRDSHGSSEPEWGPHPIPIGGGASRQAIVSPQMVDEDPTELSERPESEQPPDERRHSASSACR